MLACFESHEEALIDWTRQRRVASAQWNKYASSYDPLVRRKFKASGRIKSELFRLHLFEYYESNWDVQACSVLGMSCPMLHT